MEITTEKESMTNSDFSKALNIVLTTMSNKILLDKKEYDELLKVKSTFDTEMKSFITKYTSDRDFAYMKYNQKINKLEEQCSQVIQALIYLNTLSKDKDYEAIY